jgi:hypothetical protein
MTSPAPEAPAPAGGGSNPLTRKLGPLPVWAWIGVGLGGLLAVMYFKKGSSSTASTTGTATTTGDSQIPQFVNQTYVTGTPPTTPATTGSVVGTTPITGTTGSSGTTPATNTPPANTYVVTTNGAETLATIAKKQGVSIQDIISNTEQFGGASNHGAFVKWLQTSKNGTTGKVPKGLDLFLTASGPGAGRAPVTSAAS